MANFREKLIISADDFGVSPQANTAILCLASLGKIDRVAVMINYNLSAQEISSLLETKVKLDIHLDFPQSKNHRLKESALKRVVGFAARYLLGKHSNSRMEEAWNEQIEKFKEIFERYPDGINSHQHIHFFPAYFKVVLNLAKKYEIPFLRFGKISLLDSDSHVFKILSRLHKKNESAFRASGLDSSDYMTSLDWIKDIEKFLQNLPTIKTELVCHPERQEEFQIMQKYF
jgi:predicted glycoside hydrolase/deacetylase ChbG (UPF0249 family)